MNCPRCKEYANWLKSDDLTLIGTLIEKTGQYGKFTGCSRWPKCSYTLGNNDKPIETWQQHKKRNKITRTENAPSFTEIEKW